MYNVSFVFADLVHNSLCLSLTIEVTCFPKFQLIVKIYTMERLAEVFRVYCLRSSNGSVDQNEFDWIPGKILRCFYDRDFR